MAYDEGLADRLRTVLSGEPGLTEKRMFGGLAFLIGGNLAVSASSHVLMTSLSRLPAPASPSHSVFAPMASNSGSTRSRTRYWPTVSAGAMRLPSSRVPGSNGCCSTGP